MRVLARRCVHSIARVCGRPMSRNLRSAYGAGATVVRFELVIKRNFITAADDFTRQKRTLAEGARIDSAQDVQTAVRYACQRTDGRRSTANGARRPGAQEKAGDKRPIRHEGGLSAFAQCFRRLARLRIDDGFRTFGIRTGNGAQDSCHRSSRLRGARFARLLYAVPRNALRSPQRLSSRRSSSSSTPGSSPQSSKKATRCSEASSAHGCRFCRSLRRRISREPGSSGIPGRALRGQPEAYAADLVSDCGPDALSREASAPRYRQHDRCDAGPLSCGQRLAEENYGEPHSKYRNGVGVGPRHSRRHEPQRHQIKPIGHGVVHDSDTAAITIWGSELFAMSLHPP